MLLNRPSFFCVPFVVLSFLFSSFVTLELTMGDSSGGTPGPSGLRNLNNLLEKTKEKYQKLHPGDKRWPCPFCLIKANTLFQRKIHIRKEHPILMDDGNEQKILSQYESSFSQYSQILTEPIKEINVSTTDDLSKFLKLINETTHEDSKVRSDLSTSTTNDTNDTAELYEDDDEEVFYCPYDSTHKKSFRNRRGLNIHFGKMHPGKKKIKRDDVEYVYKTNENAETTDFGRKLAYFKITTATLRRCPKGARQDLAVSLTRVIRNIVNDNSENSWNDLLIFPYATLRIN